MKFGRIKNCLIPPPYFLKFLLIFKQFTFNEIFWIIFVQQSSLINWCFIRIGHQRGFYYFSFHKSTTYAVRENFFQYNEWVWSIVPIKMANYYGTSSSTRHREKERVLRCFIRVIGAEYAHDAFVSVLMWQIVKSEVIFLRISTSFIKSSRCFYDVA